MSDSTPLDKPPEPPRSLWRALREDPHFRTTFLVAFGLPVGLVLVVLCWIIRAMVLG